MSKPTPGSHPLHDLLPADVEGYDSLVEPALDMHWTWNHATDEVWRQLDPALWDLTHHPCDVLQTVSREKIRSALADPAFRRRIDELVRSRKQATEAPGWFQQTYPQSPLTCIAYFSMEFMLSEALPIYSGGLGNVAGDQLKAASDLGFARRFATYKRLNMLLHDPERLLRLLSNPQRPVQLIMAGKAHPSDLAGQHLIRQWQEFIRRPEARCHVIFLNDYNMLLSESLVQGADVWINTPRRPWEACGTSGMKVLVNGGLNLSELDGWWAEAYTPEIGWVLGDGEEHHNDPGWDAIEAEALYDLLEREVVPEFYSRDEQGIPYAWVNRMRESMARLTPRFCANRVVREYTEQQYVPAASTFLARAADQGAAGVAMVDWRRALAQKWTALRFGEVKVETTGRQHVFEVQLYLDDLDPEWVRVELYADGAVGVEPERVEMMRVRQLVGAANGCAYSAGVPASRPATDYTPRLIPHFAGVAIPLEEAHVLWQR